MAKPRPSVLKRQREQARREKKMAKEEKKAQRREDGTENPMEETFEVLDGPQPIEDYD